MYKLRGGGAAATKSGTAIIFRARQLFRAEACSQNDKDIFWHLLNGKEFIPSSEMKCPKSRIFTARQHSLLCRALY